MGLYAEKPGKSENFRKGEKRFFVCKYELMVAELKLLDSFFELMMDNPSLQQIIDFKASPEEEQWIQSLVDKSKSGRISGSEQLEIDYFLKVEQAVTLAKTKAFVKQKARRQ